MTVSKLSASSQNYLKAIWSLGEWSDEPVTTTALAERTGVKLSTASDAVRRLAEQGFIDHTPYGAVKLTAAGRRHALAMVRRHRLIESFLVEALKYRWDQVHDEAEVLEHAVSDFMIERIDELLRHPQRDPHGDPIPSADGKIDKPDAIRLTELGAGRQARVERIADDDARLLQFLADHGIGYGSQIETKASAPYTDTVDVTVAGSKATLPLGRSATDSMWVRPLD